MAVGAGVGIFCFWRWWAPRFHARYWRIEFAKRMTDGREFLRLRLERGDGHPVHETDWLCADEFKTLGGDGSDEA